MKKARSRTYMYCLNHLKLRTINLFQIFLLKLLNFNIVVKRHNCCDNFDMHIYMYIIYNVINIICLLDNMLHQKLNLANIPHSIIKLVSICILELLSFYFPLQKHYLLQIYSMSLCALFRGFLLVRIRHFNCL